MFKNLSHQKLIDIGIHLGYRTSMNRTGMCNGFSMMYAQAILANEESRFLERLHLIDSYGNDYKRLKKDIDNARRKTKNNKEVIKDKRTIQLLEIPAFYESVFLYQTPQILLSQYLNSFVSQMEQDIIWPFTRPQKLEGEELSFIFNKIAYFSSGCKLEEFLGHLETKLQDIEIKAPILVYSNSHAILISYNQKTRRWKFVDINRISEPHILNEITTQELAGNILTSYGTYNLMAGFKMLSLTSQKNNLPELFQEIDSKDKPHYIGDKGKLLCLASHLGFVETVQEILKEDQHPLLMKELNLSKALDLACQTKNYQIVDILLKHNSLDVNQPNENGFVPLNTSIATKCSRTLEALLKREDIDVNKEIKLPSGHKITPLFVAAYTNDNELIFQLVDHPKININIHINGYSLLHIAIEKDNVELFKKLICHPELDSKYISEAFIQVCILGNLDLIEYIIEKVDVNNLTFQGDTPLIAASRSIQTRDKSKIFTHLIRSEANLIHKCSKGNTALDYAVMAHNSTAIHEILECAKKYGLEIESIANENTRITLAIIEKCSKITNNTMTPLEIIITEFCSKKPALTVSQCCRLLDENQSIQSLIPSQYSSLLSTYKLLSELYIMGVKEQKLAKKIEESIHIFYTSDNLTQKHQIKTELQSEIKHYCRKVNIGNGLTILANIVLALSVIGIPLKLMFSNNHSAFFSKKSNAFNIPVRQHIEHIVSC